MRVSRSELSCLLSIQRESWVTVANAMSSSLAGRETPSAWLRTNRSCATPFFTPGIIGSHFVAGDNDDSSVSFRGPTLRSYTDASVLRHVEAAIARSESVSGNWTSFSASEKVVSETSGPNAGPEPNAGGAPAGSFDRSWAGMRQAAAAPGG